MKYRLGLDLGTNSIGWAVVEINDNGLPLKIIDANSRIFSDGREPKTGTSNTVARRNARGIRRNRDRKLQRMNNMLSHLIHYKLFPKENDSKQRNELKLLDPYELRHKAITEKLSSFELGRVLLTLTKKRGFKSNRLEESSQDSVFNESLTELESAVTDSKYQSFGSYLFHNKQKKNNGDQALHGTRKLYHDEFILIKNTQSPLFPDLTIDFWQKSESIIFDQRPLKPMDEFVGNCSLLKESDGYTAEEVKRIPKHMPSFQLFRIAQTIPNLSIIDNGHSIPLTQEQKIKIFEKLCSTKKQAFSQLHKLIGLKPDQIFNLESSTSNYLLGDEVGSIFSGKKYFGKEWRNFSIKERDHFIKAIASTQEREELYEYLSSDFDLNEESIENIINFDPQKLPKGYANFCLKVIRSLTPILVDNGFPTLNEAIKLAGYLQDRGNIQKSEILEYYGKVLPEAVVKRETGYREQDIYGKISNPTVHIGLGQLQKVVNQIIVRYGRPDEITIELARELKQNQKQKSRARKQQAENKKNNDEARSFIERCGEQATRNNIIKYKLWKELGASPECPYSGKPIPASKLFTREIQIEHIIPFSLSLDDSFMNKTLCYDNMNEIKNNQTPFEAFGNNTEMFERIKIFPKSKRDRFQENAKEKFLNEDQWLARQLNDTRYLSKIAKKYLSSVCLSKSISVSTGRMTANLRYILGLSNLFEGQEEKRDDHRHHAVDAITLALMSRPFLLKMRTFHHKKWSTIKDSIPYMDQVRTESLQVLQNKIVSHRLRHKYQGSFFDDTAYGITKKPILINGKKLNIIVRKDIEFIPKKKVPQIVSSFYRYQLEEIYELQDKELITKQIEHLKEKYGVKKLRYYDSHSTVEIINHPQKKQQFYKGYKAGDLAYLSVWRLPSTKLDFKGVYVFEHQKHRKDPNFLKPHPAAKLVMKLFKGDYIQTNEDQILMIKSIGPSDSNKRLVCTHPNPTNGKEKYITFNKFEKLELKKIRQPILGLNL